MSELSKGRLILGERVTDFDTIHRDARCFASGLTQAGLTQGSTLAIMLRNDEAFFTATVAAALIDATATPINWHFTADEVAYLLADSQAEAWIVHADLWRKIGADIPAEVLDGILVLVVETPKEIASNFGLGPSDCLVPSDANDWQVWLNRFAEWDGPPPKPRNAMIYTSGTTGRPKGVKRVGVVGVAKTGNYDAFVKGARVLMVAPMYHSAPNRNAVSSFFLGGDIVLQARFDAVEMLELIQRHRISHMFIVPTMMVRLQKLPADVRALYDMSSLEHVVHAGAHCPADVKRAMIEWWGPVIHEYYAGSEGNGFCALNSEEWLQHKGSVGKALLGKVHICDDEGNELPVGEAGTIYFEADDPNAPQFQYYNDEKKTRDSRHPKHKHWTTLGDIGRLDEDGYLYLTDRKAFMIISGGVNIYPQEAENLLITHPKVADVAVIGVPNPDFGEEVKAIVQPMDWADAGPELEEELIAFCQSELSKIKCPRSVDFDKELPRHPTGKLYKRLIRDKYWGNHDSKIV